MSGKTCCHRYGAESPTGGDSRQTTEISGKRQHGNACGDIPADKVREAIAGRCREIGVQISSLDEIEAGHPDTPGSPGRNMTDEDHHEAQLIADVTGKSS
jgi:hypothetical protein